jgi:hypothetical protein
MRAQLLNLTLRKDAFHTRYVACNKPFNAFC